jgi:chromosome partitioning protein
MASFKDLYFTPAEFARIAKIDKSGVNQLESQGLIQIERIPSGNVERKMISLLSVQNYFRHMRSESLSGRHGDQKNSETENETITNPAEAIIDDLSNGSGAVAAAPPEFAALPSNALFGAPSHKVQMFYNVKGGTGKSTLTAQYVMRAALMGYKVLAVDLDGQGHLTVNLDILSAHELPTIYDVLINDLPIQNAIINVAPQLDLIPANLGLCNIEIPLNQKTRREYRLGEAIAQVADQYDLIVADTNPAASILNGSMLVASQLVNVVCATNPLSFHGMSLVMATIENMEKEFKKQLDVKIIPNMYDNREVISQEVLGELHSQFPELCAKTVVNRSADLNEATKQRTAVCGVNPKGTAAQDLSSLTEELLFC